jgi:hypothetical protein
MSNLASTISKAINKKNNLSISPPTTSKNVSPQNSSLISLFNKGPTSTLNSLSKNLSSSTPKNLFSTAPKNSILGATTASITNAAKVANSAITTASTGIKNAAAGAANAATGVANAAAGAATAVVSAANAGVANVAKNMSFPSNLNNLSKNSPFMNNYVNTNVANSSTTSWGLIGGIFFLCFLIFLSIFLFFNKELQTGINNLVERTRSALGLNKPPPPPPSPVEPESPSQGVVASLVQKMLPSEVFNVSKNEYSYYDAEALCSALGADLATIDQVKEAYEKGADWCNYGWVKGQGAVYPTQKKTWDLLQLGPEEERSACGNPGVNGGHFDNPEMKFGVNCYGPKPPQSGHDESELMKNGSIPKTVAGLQVYEKINEFKKKTNEMEILPFNEGKWSTS